MLREWFNDTWTVINNGTGTNTSSNITWNLGTITPDNFTMVQYTIQAPDTSGYYNFSANATYDYDSQSSEVDGEFDPWNVTVQASRAMFEFELDLWRADAAINRTIANNTDYFAVWSVTNTGDTKTPDGENVTIRLEYNKSAWNISNITCPLCIANSCEVISVNATLNATQCLISNDTATPGTTIQVNFTIRTKPGINNYDEILTSNATYDPPPVPIPAPPKSGSIKELSKPVPTSSQLDVEGTSGSQSPTEPDLTESSTKESLVQNLMDWIYSIFRFAPEVE